MIMDWIYDFPLVSEHFFCWRDEANSSLFRASVYSASHCSEIVFLVNHGRCGLSSLFLLWIRLSFQKMQKQPPRCSPRLYRDSKWNKHNRKFWLLNDNREITLPNTVCVSLSLLLRSRSEPWADLQGCPSTSREYNEPQHTSLANSWH